MWVCVYVYKYTDMIRNQKKQAQRTQRLIDHEQRDEPAPAYSEFEAARSVLAHGPRQCVGAEGGR